jgi:hypothetical protein
MNEDGRAETPAPRARARRCKVRACRALLGPEAAERTSRCGACVLRAERRATERAAHARARAEEKTRRDRARRQREVERAERRSREHERNYAFVLHFAEDELASNGGRIPVHCAGWVAHRGRVYEGRSFDSAKADEAIDGRAGRGWQLIATAAPRAVRRPWHPSPAAPRPRLETAALPSVARSRSLQPAFTPRRATVRAPLTPHVFPPAVGTYRHPWCTSLG